MKNILLGLRLAAFIVLLLGHGLTARAALVNLAASATGSGLLPTAPLFQGSAAGIYDGSMYSWLSASASSPRDNASGNGYLGTYMTWAAEQPVRMVRIWGDAASNNYDSIRISTLTGSDPTQQANWTERYYSGTGLNQKFVDVDLGAVYSTKGVWVRGYRAGNDQDIGEVAAFAPSAYFTGSLTSMRVANTGATGSSLSGFGSAPSGCNGNWYDRFLADSQANNPGTTYWLDVAYNSASLDGVSITYAVQGGWSSLPSSWTLKYSTNNGTSYQTFGAYSVSGSRLQYYYDLGGRYNGITNLRLEVPEASFSDGLRLGVMEFEAFLTIPEPGTGAALAVASLALVSRRRRRC